MARARIHDVAAAEWLSPADLMDPVEAEALPDENRKARVRVHEDGGDASPQLVEITYPPGTQIGTHCHDADEIIYVVEGSLVAGRRELLPGSSLYVRGGTFYGFTVGDHGVRFLNFRPKKDVSYIKAPSPSVLGPKAAGGAVAL